jgi:guanylate kinase
MVLADAFVEWANVHGNRYGTSKKAIEEDVTAAALPADLRAAIAAASALVGLVIPPPVLRDPFERMSCRAGCREPLPMG